MPNANSLVTLIKGDEQLINNTQVLNGQILFDETNRIIYMDEEGVRRQFSVTPEIMDDIAFVETGTTATRGYSAGQYLWVNNILYKAKTQINSGTTFVVGTNIEAETVGTALTNINNDLADIVSDDLASQVVGETGVVKDFNIFKAGNNVVMSGKITISGGGTFGNNTKLLTVPEALRPSANRNCNFVVFGDMNSGTFGELVVNADGGVYAHFDNNTFTASIARFSISWAL